MPAELTADQIHSPNPTPTFLKPMPSLIAPSRPAVLSQATRSSHRHSRVTTRRPARGAAVTSADVTPDPHVEAVVRQYMMALGFRDEAAIASAVCHVLERTSLSAGGDRVKRALTVAVEEFAGRVAGPAAGAEAQLAAAIGRRTMAAAPRSAANRMPPASLRSPLVVRLRRLLRRVRSAMQQPVFAGSTRGV